VSCFILFASQLTCTQISDIRTALRVAPVLVAAMLDAHAFAPHDLVFVDPGEIPVDPRGCKLRSFVHDSWLTASLPTRLVLQARKTTLIEE
jgi:hypothetical protein